MKIKNERSPIDKPKDCKDSHPDTLIEVMKQEHSKMSGVIFNEVLDQFFDIKKEEQSIKYIGSYSNGLGTEYDGSTDCGSSDDDTGETSNKETHLPGK